MDEETWLETPGLLRLHRHQTEFAVGHAVSVHAEPLPTDSTRATRVVTRSVPIYEVPPITPATAEEEPVLAQAVAALLWYARGALRDRGGRPRHLGGGRADGPQVIASTATIRRAETQIRALYCSGQRRPARSPRP